MATRSSTAGNPRTAARKAPLRPQFSASTGAERTQVREHAGGGATAPGGRRGAPQKGCAAETQAPAGICGRPDSGACASSGSWLEDEPRLRDGLRQTLELLARGIRRPARVLQGASLVVMLLIGMVLLGRRSYAPRYVLRVVETDRDPKDAPRPRRKLAEYVEKGVFTSAPLLDIIHHYGLYPSLARKNPRAALDAFREDIDVDVYRNYFVEERSANSSPRSARLSVSYENPVRNVAVSVTRDLGALVVQHERTMRREQAARAAEAAKREVDARREVLESRRLDIATKRAELEHSAEPDPKLEVELAELQASADGLALRQDEAEKREASLTVGAALEARGLGMSFDVVDDASLPTRSEQLETQILIAGTSFVFALPLIVLAVGAFEPKRGRA